MNKCEEIIIIHDVFVKGIQFLNWDFMSRDQLETEELVSGSTKIRNLFLSGKIIFKIKHREYAK